jgi:hypothetical protein
MANTNSPFGFRAFGHRDGSAPTMGLERRWIYSSDTNPYFTGDPVCNSSVTYGYLQPYGGSSLAPIVAGIFAGCEYYSPAVGRVVWNSNYQPGAGAASSSPVYAYIISDPEMQFIVQASSAGIGSSQVGVNCAVLVNQSSLGNTATGISYCTIASSYGSVSGSSYPFRLIDVYSNFAPPGVNGTDNSSAYNILVVAPNNWDRKALTGVST